MDDAFLVARVRARIAELRARADRGGDAASLAHRPLGEVEIREVESRLGFAIPPALRAMYAQIGNGGFGPAYGLLGLAGGAVQEERLDAVGVYERSREEDPRDAHWAWPAALLPVVHLGCAMFLCVDCRDTVGRVVWFEPNPHEDGEPWDASFIPLGVGFAEMMFAWTEGKDPLEAFVGSEE